MQFYKATILKKFNFVIKNKNKEKGYSNTEIAVILAIIGILVSIIIPNFEPALEFVEVLIAEKYLLEAVKECQIGMVNNELEPQYSLPTRDLGIGIFNNNKFVFSHTGIEGDCYPEVGGNSLKISRTNLNSGKENYSLIINVTTGEKTHEGQIPNWLDWWGGTFSPIIIENN